MNLFSTQNPFPSQSDILERAKRDAPSPPAQGDTDEETMCSFEEMVEGIKVCFLGGIRAAYDQLPEGAKDEDEFTSLVRSIKKWSWLSAVMLTSEQHTATSSDIEIPILYCLPLFFKEMPASLLHIISTICAEDHGTDDDSPKGWYPVSSTQISQDSVHLIFDGMHDWGSVAMNILMPKACVGDKFTVTVDADSIPPVVNPGFVQSLHTNAQGVTMAKCEIVRPNSRVEREYDLETLQVDYKHRKLPDQYATNGQGRFNRLGQALAKHGLYPWCIPSQSNESIPRQYLPPFHYVTNVGGPYNLRIEVNGEVEIPPSADGNDISSTVFCLVEVHWFPKSHQLGKTVEGNTITRLAKHFTSLKSLEYLGGVRSIPRSIVNSPQAIKAGRSKRSRRDETTIRENVLLRFSNDAASSESASLGACLVGGVGLNSEAIWQADFIERVNCSGGLRVKPIESRTIQAVPHWTLRIGLETSGESLAHVHYGTPPSDHQLLMTVPTDGGGGGGGGHPGNNGVTGDDAQEDDDVVGEETLPQGGLNVCVTIAAMINNASMFRVGGQPVPVCSVDSDHERLLIAALHKQYFGGEIETFVVEFMVECGKGDMAIIMQLPTAVEMDDGRDGYTIETHVIKATDDGGAIRVRAYGPKPTTPFDNIVSVWLQLQGEAMVNLPAIRFCHSSPVVAPDVYVRIILLLIWGTSFLIAQAEEQGGLFEPKDENAMAKLSEFRSIYLSRMVLPSEADALGDLLTFRRNFEQGTARTSGRSVLDALSLIEHVRSQIDFCRTRLTSAAVLGGKRPNLEQAKSDQLELNVYCGLGHPGDFKDWSDEAKRSVGNMGTRYRGWYTAMHREHSILCEFPNLIYNAGFADQCRSLFSRRDFKLRETRSRKVQDLFRAGFQASLGESDVTALKDNCGSGAINLEQHPSSPITLPRLVIRMGSAGSDVGLKETHVFDDLSIFLRDTSGAAYVNPILPKIAEIIDQMTNAQLLAGLQSATPGKERSRDDDDDADLRSELRTILAPMKISDQRLLLSSVAAGLCHPLHPESAGRVKLFPSEIMDSLKTIQQRVRDTGTGANPPIGWELLAVLILDCLREGGTYQHTEGEGFVVAAASAEEFVPPLTLVRPHTEAVADESIMPVVDLGTYCPAMDDIPPSECNSMAAPSVLQTMMQNYDEEHGRAAAGQSARMHAHRSKSAGEGNADHESADNANMEDRNIPKGVGTFVDDEAEEE